MILMRAKGALSLIRCPRPPRLRVNPYFSVSSVSSVVQNPSAAPGRPIWCGAMQQSRAKPDLDRAAAAKARRAKPAEPRISKSQRRREDILKKATELFDRQGYANTSLDDIARAVGIAREGIYYYFKNRAEILLHIIEPRSLALIHGLRAIMDAPGKRYADKLHDAVRNHLEQFDLH